MPFYFISMVKIPIILFGKKKEMQYFLIQQHDFSQLHFYKHSCGFNSRLVMYK